MWSAAPVTPGSDYDFGVGFTAGAVSVVLLADFLCFRVYFFFPFFVTELSLFVSVDELFFSTCAAAVGCGAGAADCCAIAAMGRASANAITTDFFISFLLSAAVLHASRPRKRTLRARR
jgi:hypothetical protein